jgi:chemotaxis protein histidine kinase CheA
MSDIWSLLSSFDQILSNVTTIASGVQSSVNVGNITGTSGATTAYNDVLTIQAQLNSTYASTQADLDFWKQLKADNAARGNSTGVSYSQQMIDSLLEQAKAVESQQFQASQVAVELAAAQAAALAAQAAAQIAAQAAAAQAAAQLAAQQAAQAAAQAAAQQAAAQAAAQQAAAEQAAALKAAQQAAAQQAAQEKAAADAEAARQSQIKQAQAQEAARQQAEAEAAARAKAEAEAEVQRQSAIQRAAQEAQLAAQVAQAEAAAKFAAESRAQDELQNQGSFTDIITIVGQDDNIAGAKYYPLEPTTNPLPVGNPNEVPLPVYAGGSIDFSGGLANEDRATDGSGDQAGDSSGTGGSSVATDEGGTGSQEESQVVDGSSDEEKSPFEKLVEALTAKDKPEEKSGTFTENGYAPAYYPFYPPQQPPESSGTNFLPFGLLIGAGLLFIAKEDKKKK